MQKIHAGEVEAIFEHWKEIMESPRSRMDLKRREAIAGRLRDGYSMSDLCDAINGCRASRFHMGENDRHKTYNDIGLICRDAEHIDRFIDEWESISKKAEVIALKETQAGKPVSEMSAEERQSASARMREVMKIVSRA